jgi:hypothetical protein
MKIYLKQLIDYIFHLYGDVEGQQNFDLSSALRAFEQGGIVIVPHQL